MSVKDEVLQEAFRGSHCLKYVSPFENLTPLLQDIWHNVIC